MQITKEQIEKFLKDYNIKSQTHLNEPIKTEGLPLLNDASGVWEFIKSCPPEFLQSFFPHPKENTKPLEDFFKSPDNHWTNITNPRVQNQPYTYNGHSIEDLERMLTFRGIAGCPPDIEPKEIQSWQDTDEVWSRLNNIISSGATIKLVKDYAVEMEEISVPSKLNIIKAPTVEDIKNIISQQTKLEEQSPVHKHLAEQEDRDIERLAKRLESKDWIKKPPYEFKDGKIIKVKEKAVPYSYFKMDDNFENLYRYSFSPRVNKEYPTTGIISYSITTTPYPQATSIKPLETTTASPMTPSCMDYSEDVRQIQNAPKDLASTAPPHIQKEVEQEISALSEYKRLTRPNTTSSISNFTKEEKEDDLCIIQQHCVFYRNTDSATLKKLATQDLHPNKKAAVLQVLKERAIYPETEKDAIPTGVKHSQFKPCLDTVINKQFPNALYLVSLATEYGSQKYKGYDDDKLNFTRVPTGSQGYFEASARHNRERVETDSESELPHFIHALWDYLAAVEMLVKEREFDVKKFAEDYLKELHSKK